MTLQVISVSKETDRGSSEKPESPSDRLMFGDPREFILHPNFANLLPVAQDQVEKMTGRMRDNGYYKSSIVTLGIWPGRSEPVVIDGHTRIQVAIEVGVPLVPYVIVEFADEMEALRHAIDLQTTRRKTTDGVYYRLCEQFDSLLKRGGDRRSEKAKSMTSSLVIEIRGPSASARITAKIIGSNSDKVDKIRRIRRDGWPEIQEAVRNDEMSISKAYNLIRKMELGEDDDIRKRKLTPGQIKVIKSVLSEENFIGLEAMGGNLGSLLNAAVERLIGGSGYEGPVDTTDKPAPDSVMSE